MKQQLRGPVWVNTINKSPQSDPHPPPHSWAFSFFKTLASPSGSNFKRDVKPATTSCETCALSRDVEDPPPPPRAKITCAQGDPVDLGFFAGRRKAPGLPEWGCQSGGENITALSCWRAAPLQTNWKNSHFFSIERPEQRLMCFGRYRLRGGGQGKKQKRALLYKKRKSGHPEE